MRFLIPKLVFTVLFAVGSTRADDMGWFAQMLSNQQPKPVMQGGMGSGFGPGDLTAGLVSPSFLGEPSAVLNQAKAQQMQLPAGFSMVQPNQMSRDSIILQTGCSTNPCQNGGTCLPISNSVGFTCKCPWGFTGARCDVGLTECASSPCPPNKVCKARFGGGFDCLCPANRVGANCEIHNDLCERNPCLNGGVCSAVIGGSFKCECVKPWAGVNCEKMFQNPCDENTLRSSEVRQFMNPWDRHGFLICVDRGTFHEMKCSVGTYFNEDLNHCVPDGYEPPKCPAGYCLNDGECLVDENNLLRCSCKKGFSGERCAVNIDECALVGNAACSGGRCVDQVNGYYCVCASGDVGLNCHQTIRNPCTPENVQSSRNFFELPSLESNVYLQCTGPLEFEVRKCPDNLHWHQEEQTCSLERAPLKAGICLTFPCKNGGECQENAGSAAGFSCVCKSGYTGLLCDQMIDFCLSNPCQNDGKCLPYAGGYTCICMNNIIDECCCNGISNPCPPRSKIVPGVNNYFEHAFKQRYIHCDFDGRAFVRTCAPGTIWNQDVLTCTPEKYALHQKINASQRLIDNPPISAGVGGYGNLQAPIISSTSNNNNNYGSSYQQQQQPSVVNVQQPIAQTSQSYGSGYQTPSAPVVSLPQETSSSYSSSYQQPSISAPLNDVPTMSSGYGSYNQPAVVETTTPAAVFLTETSTAGYGGYQTSYSNLNSQPIMSSSSYASQMPMESPALTVPTNQYNSPSSIDTISESPSNNYQQSQLQQLPMFKSSSSDMVFPKSSFSSSPSSFQNQFPSMSNTFNPSPSSSMNMFGVGQLSSPRSSSFSSNNNFQPSQQATGFLSNNNGLNSLQSVNSFSQVPQTGFFRSGSQPMMMNPSKKMENTFNLSARRKFHHKTQ